MEREDLLITVSGSVSMNPSAPYRPRRLLPALLGGTLLVGSLTAGMIDSQESSSREPESASRHKNKELILATSHREEVKEHVERLGLTPKDLAARLDKLSDSELEDSAKRLEKVLPGGDSFREEPLYKRLAFWAVWLAIFGLIAVLV